MNKHLIAGAVALACSQAALAQGASSVEIYGLIDVGIEHVTGVGATEQADTALFHIKGTSALNTVAVEVNSEAASLNSDDTFVVVTPAQVGGAVLFLYVVLG